MLDAPFHCGSLSGKWRPISPSDAAPSTASVTAWHAASASEWPSAPSSGRDCHSAKDQRPAFDEPVKIVADAGTRRRSDGGARRVSTRAIEVGRRRDLHVRPIAFHNPDRMAGPLGEPGFVGRVDARAAERDGVAKHVERRNACGVCAR